MRTAPVVALLLLAALLTVQCSAAGASARGLSQSTCPRTYMDALMKAGESSKVKADVPRVCAEREL